MCHAASLGGMFTRRGTLPAALACATIALLAGCGDSDDAGDAPVKAEPTAGQWKPWVLKSGADVAVAPPPRAGSAAARRDEHARDAAVRGRTPAQERQAREQASGTAVDPWMSHALEFVAERVKNPPLASRAYGLVSIAM